MKKFIISDIHGNSNIYYSIMNYLENINKEEEVKLYINGDIIDRGEDSAEILLDLRERILQNKGIKIEYLGGNHELMMYQASLERRNGVWPVYSDWFYNMGWVTAYALEELVTEQEENEIIKFISNLKIYHRFKETLDDKEIVLVHAKCPENPLYNCNLKVEDNTYEIEELLWTRKFYPRSLIKHKIGNDDYFTIIGHTPLNTATGYNYDEEENTLNIDGGCAPYVIGRNEFNHSPLVEIDSNNNRLKILTFNNNNEIIQGNYFVEKKSIPMDNIELDKNRKYINKKVKTKKFTMHNNKD